MLGMAVGTDRPRPGPSAHRRIEGHVAARDVVPQRFEQTGQRPHARTGDRDHVNVHAFSRSLVLGTLPC